MTGREVPKDDDVYLKPKGLVDDHLKEVSNSIFRGSSSPTPNIVFRSWSECRPWDHRGGRTTFNPILMPLPLTEG